MPLRPVLTALVVLLWPAAVLSAQADPSTQNRTVVILSGLQEDRGGALAALLAERLPERLKRPAALRVLAGASGVAAAGRLVQARPDGLTLGLLPIEAAITRELALASPYTAAELSGRLVVFEEPWALVAGPEAPFDDLASLAEAAGRGEVVYGHPGLEVPTVPVLQVLALARDLGVDLKPKRVPDLDPRQLIESRSLRPVMDVMAWPLSKVHRYESLPLKIVAVLADEYEGPCAPPEKALGPQGRRAAAKSLAALYEPAGLRSEAADATLEAAAAVLEGPEAAAIMAEDCLTPSKLGLSGSPAALAAEYEAQAALLRSLGLAAGD